MSSITFIGDDFESSIAHMGLYSDGTPMVKTDEWSDIVDNANTVVLKPKSMADFYTGLMLVEAVGFAGGWVTKLVLPYLPGARQDRTNPTGDVLFTARSVARAINMGDFSKVVVLDPHSAKGVSFLHRKTEYPLERVASRMWQGYSGIIAPDKGAKDRAEKFAEAMGKPIYYGSKERDVSTGRLSGFGIDVPRGGHYLVVDDICDGGGTFIGLAEKIRECGAFADLYVSHGIFSKGTDDLKKCYKNIYTTDSRDIDKRNDVLAIPVVDHMVNF